MRYRRISFHHRTGRRSERPACRPGWLHLAVIASGLLAAAPALGEASPGGPAADRKYSQGRDLQGTALPDRAPRWLQGRRFIAQLDEHASIEIDRFAGDTVHGTVTDAQNGYHGQVELNVTNLIGMRWTESRCGEETCVEQAFRVTDVLPPPLASGVESSSRESDESDAWLFRVEYREATRSSGEVWRDACASPDDRSGQGLFVDGQWLPDSSWSGEGYTFSCRRGVVAKCAIEWRYRPWAVVESSRHGEIELRPLHLACTRAARAEYCGDGISYTQDGVTIDLFDIYGINLPERDPRFVDESSWDDRGAVEIHHLRVPGRGPPGDGLDGCRSGSDEPRPGPASLRVRSERSSGQPSQGQGG